MRVSSAEFLKSFEELSAKALSEPITTTQDGEDHLVLVSASEYARVKRRDRRVLRLEDFTPEEMKAIKEAKIPAQYAHLDDELKDWASCCSRGSQP
jgi:hypothetical protein